MPEAMWFASSYVGESRSYVAATAIRHAMTSSVDATAQAPDRRISTLVSDLMDMPLLPVGATGFERATSGFQSMRANTPCCTPRLPGAADRRSFRNLEKRRVDERPVVRRKRCAPGRYEPR